MTEKKRKEKEIKKRKLELNKNKLTEEVEINNKFNSKLSNNKKMMVGIKSKEVLKL